MNIHFVTPSNEYNGYGIAESLLKKYFAKLGIQLDKNFTGQQISLVLNLATALVHAKGKIKILYTMIEGDTYPPEWVELCKQADYVIAPNAWSSKVLTKAGIKSEIIPLGYDSEVFKLVEREEKDVFTFLHYEAFQDRKGWDDLLDAWMLSLSDNEEAQLILKTIKPWDEVPKRVKEFINVKVISGELPHEAIASLLGAADCFVFPSRGEGFSLPPLEAMATGLPVILTKGHSHLDYYDEKFMYGVEVSKKIPAKYPWFDYQIGEWVRVNIDDLAEKIEYVFQNKDKAKAKGKTASKEVKRLSANESARAWQKFLTALDK